VLLLGVSLPWLQVKNMTGLGTTMDCVLVNGKLREGDKIVVCSLSGPVVSRIKALKTPQVGKCWASWAGCTWSEFASHVLCVKVLSSWAGCTWSEFASRMLWVKVLLSWVGALNLPAVCCG
jgi:hypothetical protein